MTKEEQKFGRVRMVKRIKSETQCGIITSCAPSSKSEQAISAADTGGGLSEVTVVPDPAALALLDRGYVVGL